MKSERRHELQQQDLAIILERWIEKLKPYVPAVLLGAVVLVCIWGATTYFKRRSLEESAVAWTQYYEATESNLGNTQKLIDLEDAKQGLAVEQWASIAIADEGLRKGLNQLMTDRQTANIQLSQAIEKYEKILDSADDAILKGQAAYGKGLALEGLNKLSEAEETYNSVEGPLKEVAQERAKFLSTNKDVQKFYSWFATAQLPTVPTGPGTPGVRPPFEPGDPSSFVPDFSKGGTSATVPIPSNNVTFDSLLGDEKESGDKSGTDSLPPLPEVGRPPEPPVEPESGPSLEAPEKTPQGSGPDETTGATSDAPTSAAPAENTASPEKTTAPADENTEDAEK